MAIYYGDGTNSTSGRVIQVVSAHKSDATSTTSTSFTDTGLQASITPKDSTNKILYLTNL